MVSLNYIPYSEFDGADNTATPPDVYEILMDFYVSEITGNTNLPSGYNGQTNKGHADLVEAQWKNNCPDLTVYNRKVVYDQDFLSKGNLTVAPQETPGNSYAHPIISDKEFTVEPGTTVSMVAAKTIVLKPGTHIKAGSNFYAYIDPSLCNNNVNRKTDKKTYIDKDITQEKTSTEQAAPTERKVENYLYKNSIKAFPNPFNSYTVIQFSLQKESTISLSVFDIFGRPVFDKISSRQLEQGIYNVPLGGDNLSAGVYHCVLTIDNNIRLAQTIIKE